MKLKAITSIFVTIIILFSCQQPVVEEKPVIRKVMYQQVSKVKKIKERTFSGLTKPVKEIGLSFKVPGTIDVLAVEIGSVVKKGDIIAQLVKQDYNIKVHEAKAMLLSAKAQQRNAKAHYKRIQQLYERQNASRADLDAARTNSETTQAQVQTASEQLEYAKLQLSYTDLKAPEYGYITDVRVETNENVKSGDKIAIIVAGSTLDVEVSIPAKYIAKIRKGNDSFVKIDASKNKSYAGVVSEVGVSPTGNATQFPVIIKLTNPDDSLRPGMVAEVTFTFDFDDAKNDDKDFYIVPSVAVGEDRSGRFVYIVKPTQDGFGTVHRSAVKVGEFTSDGIEIYAGVNDGTLVVTAGVGQIKEGQKVRVEAP